jgi:hypothetical protein
MEKRMCSLPQSVCREKTKTKNIKIFRGERVNYWQVFGFCCLPWNPNPAKSDATTSVFPLNTKMSPEISSDF